MWIAASPWCILAWRITSWAGPWPHEAINSAGWNEMSKCPKLYWLRVAQSWLRKDSYPCYWQGQLLRYGMVWFCWLWPWWHNSRNQTDAIYCVTNQHNALSSKSFDFPLHKDNEKKKNTIALAVWKISLVLSVQHVSMLVSPTHLVCCWFCLPPKGFRWAWVPDPWDKCKCVTGS